MEKQSGGFGPAFSTVTYEGCRRLNPLLSVIMPVHNGEKFISIALESIRAQFCDGIEIVIVNDGSTDDTNKLGAIGDIHFVLKTQNVDDDLIVVAGDNLFSDKLPEFGKFCREKNAPVLALYDVGNLEEIKKYNAISTNGDGRITFFEEKPKNPTSTLTGIGLYFYPKSTIPLIQQYIAEGNNPDQPGRLVQWLYPRTPFYTWRVPGLWYDIGSKETLEEANKIFAKFK